MSFSVIIPSRNAANLVPCVAAVRKHEPEARIIVVDDGLDLEAEHAKSHQHCWMCDVDPIVRIQGVKPFIFARNINLGIAIVMKLANMYQNLEAAFADGHRDAASRATDAVVILNDDALLETPGGFSLLASAAEEHPEYGLIASTCNNVGNRNQWRQPAAVSAHTDGLRDEPRMVCFVAVLIPRRTIETVGLLDEEFVNYGCEDDSYSLRVRRAKLKIGIHDGCYVDHGSLTSSFRGAAGAGGDFRPNLKIFIEKYGVDNWGKSMADSDFFYLFPEFRKS